MALAQGLGSRRVAGQIDLVHRRLGRWRQDPAVASLRRSLKVLVDSFIAGTRSEADESDPADGDNSGRENTRRSVRSPSGRKLRAARRLPAAGYRHRNRVCDIAGTRRTYPLLQLPPVTISCSHEHSAWHGTVSISSSTLHSMINDILPFNCRYRPDLAGHRELPRGQLCPGQRRPGRKRPRKSMALFPSGTDWAEARQAARLATTSHEDMHAGELETSILLHAEPRSRPRRLSSSGLGQLTTAPSAHHRDERIYAKRSDRPTIAGFRGTSQELKCQAATED